MDIWNHNLKKKITNIDNVTNNVTLIVVINLIIITGISFMIEKSCKKYKYYTPRLINTCLF
jgi:hypothetical protein